MMTEKYIDAKYALNASDLARLDQQMVSEKENTHN